MKRFVVKKSDEGLSLLAFLGQSLSFSNKEIKRRIEGNCCRLNGVVERIASKKVILNDRVEWDDHFVELEVAYDPKRILYQDDELLVYNKSPGVACDAEGILKLLKPLGRLFLVHRLDKFTSGVLVLAKTREAEKEMLEAFKGREVEKGYVAICDGVPKQKSGEVDNYLGKVGGMQGQTLYGAVSSKVGKHAKTAWALKTPYKNAALIACSPETGRTHQIRVHMSGLGHPVLGDFQYGKSFRCKVKPPRMLLHAYQIKYKNLFVKAPIPKDFQDVVKLLT
jgi:RluA family pseudouridine synthase